MFNYFKKIGTNVQCPPIVDTQISNGSNYPGRSFEEDHNHHFHKRVDELASSCAGLKQQKTSFIIYLINDHFFNFGKLKLLNNILSLKLPWYKLVEKLYPSPYPLDDWGFGFKPETWKNR